MSESMNLLQRMNAVMKDVAYVQKDEKKVAGQYRAVTHDAVCAKLRPSMVEHGIVVSVSVVDHAIADTWDKSGSRWTCVDATIVMTFMNIDAPQDQLAVQAFGYGIDNGDKGPGKAISYAVKYALLKCFSLETGDDPDNDQGPDHQRPSTGTRTPATPALERPSKPSKPQKPTQDGDKGPDYYRDDIGRMVEEMSGGGYMPGGSMGEILMSLTTGDWTDKTSGEDKHFDGYDDPSKIRDKAATINHRKVREAYDKFISEGAKSAGQETPSADVGDDDNLPF